MNKNTRVSRPYQRDCIDFCARAFREAACRVLAIVMPTGAGKTFTVASLLAEHGSVFHGVLVVAPQIAIAEAWRREVRDAGLSDAYFRVITHAAALNLTAAELGALDNQLLVVDEAHHARDIEADSTGVGAFANYWHANGGIVLFVTATPFMNGRSSLPHGTVRWSRSIAAHALPDPVTGEKYMPSRVRMAVVYVPIEDVDDDDFIADVVSVWVERWRLDGRQKAVFIVPSHMPGGSRRFANDLIEALRASHPGVRVQNCVGEEGSVKRSTLEALERESQLTHHADSRVDVMVSAVRFNEGTDWKFASAVYRYGVSSSFTLGMQQAGRAFRQKPDDHPERDVATYCCFVPMLPDDAVASWERYHRDMVGLLVAHLESGDTGQAYISVVQKPVRQEPVRQEPHGEPSADAADDAPPGQETGEGEPSADAADGTPPGQGTGEGENEGRADSGEEPGEVEPDAPSRAKLRKRSILRPDMREKFDAAFSVYLYEDPEFMRLRAEVQAGNVTGTSAQRVEWLLRSQLDAGDAVRWSGARWTPKTEAQRTADAAKRAKIAAAVSRTPEWRVAQAEKVAAGWAARTPEQRAATAAKVAARMAALTPDQREARRAAHAAKLASAREARTPEQWEDFKAKQAKTREARTPEQRAATAAKFAAVKEANMASRTPEQRALHAECVSAAIAKRTPEQRAVIASKLSEAAAKRTPEQRAANAARAAGIAKAALASYTPEQREAVVAKREAKRAKTIAARTPEQRSAYAAKRAETIASRTPEQRAAHAEKRAAAAARRTPEQRAAYTEKRAAAAARRTPEQRAAYAEKRAAAAARRTPEQRAETVAKRAATAAVTRTPEWRVTHAEKVAAGWAARTPEQREASKAKRAATKAATKAKQAAKRDEGDLNPA